MIIQHSERARTQNRHQLSHPRSKKNSPPISVHIDQLLATQNKTNMSSSTTKALNCITRDEIDLLKGETVSKCDIDFFGQFSSATPKETSSSSSQTKKTMPSRGEVGMALTDEKAALRFLDCKGVIQLMLQCPHCQGNLLPMSKSLQSKSRFVVRCRKRRCKGFSISVLEGSILTQCKFPKHQFVELAYQWLLNNKYNSIARSMGMSPNTITDWSNYFREAVSSDLLLGGDCQIGGPGIIVEIDESKFGKRKYNVSICVRIQFSALTLAHNWTFS